jgi:two-component system phosphate regulon sensor histidine kinase PhoR
LVGPRAWSIYHVIASSLFVCTSSLITLAVCALWGLAAGWTALTAGTVTLIATALVTARLVNDFAVVRKALDKLATDEGSEALSGRGSCRIAPLPRELWLTVVRVNQLWRERLRSAEGQLAAAEAVIAAVPDPLILLDERRRIVRANAQAAALVGPIYEHGDLATALRHPAVLTAADTVLRGATAQMIDFTTAFPIVRQLRAHIARIDRPSLGGAVAVLVLHDITQLKRSEQMRADFIANASHELRTPLATLIGFIETLSGPARDDAEARDRFLAIMHGQAARMARLIEDLLSLSRIELNEHVMPNSRIALRPLLHQVSEVFELRAGERDMTIRLDVPADLPDVLGDRDELAQVFQNLVDNAIKYGGAGTEITIKAATVFRPSRRGGAFSCRFVSIAVRDRGDGIAREHLPRLTERFYRVDTARSRQMGGTGLGLAIVKHILNRHRGLLEIDSTPGEGSVFTVLLHAYPSASVSSSSQPAML